MVGFCDLVGVGIAPVSKNLLLSSFFKKNFIHLFFSKNKLPVEFQISTLVLRPPEQVSVGYYFTVPLLSKIFRLAAYSVSISTVFPHIVSALE